jgi:transcriptional regulator with XRE-family HTH domain
MRIRKINDQQLIALHKKGVSQNKIAERFGVSPAAVSKRLKFLGMKTPASFQNLTEKEKSFCLEYAAGSSATEAAMKTFDTSNRDSAKSYGSTLLKKPGIRAAISDVVNFYSPKHARAEKLAQHIHEGSEPASLKGLELAFRLDRSLEKKEEAYHPPCIPLEKYLDLHAHYNVHIKFLEATNMEKEENHSKGYYEEKYHEMLGVMSKVLTDLINMYESETGEVVAPELTKIVDGILERTKKNE